MMNKHVESYLDVARREEAKEVLLAADARIKVLDDLSKSGINFKKLLNSNSDYRRKLAREEALTIAKRNCTLFDGKTMMTIDVRILPYIENNEIGKMYLSFADSSIWRYELRIQLLENICTGLVFCVDAGRGKIIHMEEVRQLFESAGLIKRENYSWKITEYAYKLIEKYNKEK